MGIDTSGIYTWLLEGASGEVSPKNEIGAFLDARCPRVLLRYIEDAIGTAEIQKILDDNDIDNSDH